MSPQKRTSIFAALLCGGLATGAYAQNVSEGEIDRTTGQPVQQEQGGQVNTNELAEPTAGTSSDAAVIDAADGTAVTTDQGMERERIVIRSGDVSNPAIQPRGVHTRNLGGVEQVYNALGAPVSPGSATVDNATAGLDESGRLAQ